jgi:acyl-CoA dehydrogenase
MFYYLYTLLLLYVLIIPALYFKHPLRTWTLSSFTLLMYLSINWGITTTFWAGWALFLIIITVPLIRRQLFSRWCFLILKNKYKPISQTEEEALSIGDPWYEQGLFQGVPEFSRLFSEKKTNLKKEEQAFMENETRSLCLQLSDWSIIHKNHGLSKKIWSILKSQGFFGLEIPKKYKGKGFSTLAHSSIIKMIASRSVPTAVSTMVPNSLGPAELIQKYGNESQKKQFLTALAQGKEIPCFALTETMAGSDATSIEAEGLLFQDPKSKKLMIKLNFSKRYITLAPVATLLGIAFQLHDPEQHFSKEKKLGITLALISHKQKGISIKKHDPLGLAFENGAIIAKDVIIPADAIIGGVNNAGKGWPMLVECLAIGRAISLPAVSCANACLASIYTGAYAKCRKQFNSSIGNFSGIQTVLAKIGGLTYLMESARSLTIRAVDQGLKPAVASSIVKYHLTEYSREIINHAMDIHGGRSIIMGPKNYLADLYFAVPISITVEGANILTRNLMIFGQGAVRCHPYIKAMMDAVKENDPKRALKNFDQNLIKYFAYLGRNKVRAIWSALTLSKLVCTPKTPLRPYQKRIIRLSRTFAYLADIAFIVYGSNLKTKERQSARLADALSHLYLAFSVIKMHQERNWDIEERPYVHWAIEWSLYQAQEAEKAFVSNLPWLGSAIRFITFPFGGQEKKPSDALERELSLLMQSNHQLRDDWKKSIVINEDPHDPKSIIERAFQTQWITDTIEQKIKTWAKKEQRGCKNLTKLALQAEAQGIIQATELQAWQKKEQLLKQSMEVDCES